MSDAFFIVKRLLDAATALAIYFCLRIFWRLHVVRRVERIRVLLSGRLPDVAVPVQSRMQQNDSPVSGKCELYGSSALRALEQLTHILNDVQ